MMNLFKLRKRLVFSFIEFLITVFCLVNNNFKIVVC